MFRVGRHVNGNDAYDIRFMVAYGNQLIFGAKTNID